MAKEVIFGDEARRRMKAGIDKLADAVRITLGPRGRNVIIDKKFGSPDITNDGVTIAQEQEYKDPYENMGAQLVKEVASKTNDIAGDGTTTATILAHAMIEEGFKNLAAGANPMELKRGLEKGAEKIVTCTLHYKPWSAIKPDCYLKETEAWVIYPWEINEMSKSRQRNLRNTE